MVYKICETDTALYRADALILCNKIAYLRILCIKFHAFGWIYIRGSKLDLLLGLNGVKVSIFYGKQEIRSSSSGLVKNFSNINRKTHLYTQFKILFRPIHFNILLATDNLHEDPELSPLEFVCMIPVSQITGKLEFT